MRLIDADAFDKRLVRLGALSIKSALDEEPTIEAESVRHGRWVKRGQDIFCSECDEESGYTWAGASRYSDYCPNCGARMDLEG